MDPKVPTRCPQSRCLPLLNKAIFYALPPSPLPVLSCSLPSSSSLVSPPRSVVTSHQFFSHRSSQYGIEYRSIRYGNGVVQASPSGHLAGTLSQALISSEWGIWAVLASAGAAGLHLERTRWGKEMSGALLSTLLGLSLSNLGIVPSETHIYGVVNSYLLPLAVPMLLFAADLRRVVRETGRLLVAFAMGAIASVSGSFLAFSFLKLRSLGVDGWKVAASLTARHIGGSVNFFAVSEVLGVSSEARMAALAADDVIVSLYFIAIYSLARRHRHDDDTMQKSTVSVASHMAEGDVVRDEAGIASADSGGAEESKRSITVLQGATSIAVSAAIVACGSYIAKALDYSGGTITVVTAISVALATLAPGALQPLVSSGEALATILMQLFFASVGASGNIRTVLRTAPMLFAWSAMAIITHLLLMLFFERVFRFSRLETCLASNANIGGPTTAAAMAAAKDWRGSVVPALLVGLFGYATATFIGVSCAAVFRWMQALV